MDWMDVGKDTMPVHGTLEETRVPRRSPTIRIVPAHFLSGVFQRYIIMKHHPYKLVRFESLETFIA